MVAAMGVEERRGSSAETAAARAGGAPQSASALSGGTMRVAGVLPRACEREATSRESGMVR